MTVYEIVPHKSYIEGIALVAAESKNVAINLWIKEDERNKDLWYEGKCSCFVNTDLKAVTDTPKVLIDKIVDIREI